MLHLALLHFTLLLLLEGVAALFLLTALLQLALLGFALLRLTLLHVPLLRLTLLLQLLLLLNLALLGIALLGSALGLLALLHLIAALLLLALRPPRHVVRATTLRLRRRTRLLGGQLLRRLRLDLRRNGLDHLGATVGCVTTHRHLAVAAPAHRGVARTVAIAVMRALHAVVRAHLRRRQRTGQVAAPGATGSGRTQPGSALRSGPRTAGMGWMAPPDTGSTLTAVGTSR